MGDSIVYMELVLPLKQMTLSDKLRMMEQLWEDLCGDPQSIPSPAWHDEVLQAREKQVKDGSARFVDWQQAKQQIRELVK